MKTLILLPLAFVLAAATAFAQTESIKDRQFITPKNYPISITNMGEGINTSYDDFSPLVLGNGRVMYFTSNREGDQNIYTAVSSGYTWTQVMNVGPSLNTGDNDGSATMTPDGHWNVFAACDREGGLGDCDLAMAEYAGGAWRSVRNITTVNSPSWESQPSISADGLMLFFASDRPGGFGGSDLWMSKRGNGGEWSVPVNLGPNVNTPGDEMSPSIAADNRTLYFSSNGHPGVGGFDVYVSKSAGDSWATPENAGTPINTASDEMFFTTQLGTDNVYFASTRSGGSGALDIYLGVPNPIPPNAVTAVIGTVSDVKTKSAIGATLTVRDIKTNEVVSTFHSNDQDGNYIVVLQPGKSYAITSEAPGYLFYSDRFDVPRDAANTTVRKNIEMTRDMVRLLVYFDFNMAVLQEGSYVDLDRAVQFLKDNPKMRVELAGHTDNVGTREYNVKLSSDRAKAVADYLASKGVSASRLSAKGYAFDEPVTTNDTEEGRAQNRRVEFRVK